MFMKFYMILKDQTLIYISHLAVESCVIGLEFEPPE